MAMSSVLSSRKRPGRTWPRKKNLNKTLVMSEIGLLDFAFGKILSIDKTKNVLF